MNILFLDEYFEPEQIAFTHLEHDLIEKLVEKGNEIQIVCPTPTRGISKEVAEAFRHRLSETLYDGHVHVTRFSAPQEGRNPVLRAFRYFWCNLRTYQIGKKKKSADLVFCNSTPPTQGWIAGKVAKHLKVPLVYSLQDIFPDSLVTTGLSNQNSLLWKLGRRIEEKTYKACFKIIVITDAMKGNLLAKNVESKKIEVISNWIDTDQIKPVSKQGNNLFEEFGIDRSKYIVLYAGNFGEAQGAEIVLEAAKKLQNDDNLFFVVFGGGSGYEEAAEKAKELNNVFIHPLMPGDRISEVYSMGDVALVTCKKGVGKSGMPSKLWSIMACNTRVIASYDLDSELCSIIREYGVGQCVEPQNSDKLVEAILSEYATERVEQTDSRIAVLQIASKNICVSNYLKQFQAAVECRK